MKRNRALIELLMLFKLKKKKDFIKTRSIYLDEEQECLHEGLVNKKNACQPLSFQHLKFCFPHGLMKQLSVLSAVLIFFFEIKKMPTLMCYD